MIQIQPQLLQGRNCDESTNRRLLTQTLQAPAAKVSTFSFAVGKLRDIAICLLAHGESDCPATVALIGDPMRLDKNMTNWTECGGSRWAPKTAWVHLKPREQRMAHYLSDLQISKVWNHYRLWRVILHDTMITIIEALMSWPVLQSDYNLESVEVDSLCAIKDMLCATPQPNTRDGIKIR